MSLLSKLKEFKKSWEYLAEGMKIDFSSRVYDFMQTKGINRTELAKRLGTSPAYVTKILSGTANPSLETMAKIAHALDTKIEIELAENNTWQTVSAAAVEQPPKNYAWITTEKPQRISTERNITNEHSDNRIAA